MILYVSCHTGVRSNKNTDLILNLNLDLIPGHLDLIILNGRHLDNLFNFQNELNNSRNI